MKTSMKPYQPRFRLDGDTVTIYTETRSLVDRFEKEGYKTIQDGKGWFCTIDINMLRRKEYEHEGEKVRVHRQ